METPSPQSKQKSSSERSLEPVAMVTDVAGGASILTDKTANPLQLLTYLSEGNEIRLEAGARLVITLFDSPVEHAFSGPARLVVGPGGVKAVEGSDAKTRRLDTDRAAAVRGSAPTRPDRLAVAMAQMRGLARPKVKLLGPVNTQVLTVAPEFSWTPLPGVEKYRLVVADGRGDLVYDVSVEGTSWLPSSRSALRYGATYDWRVEAELPSGGVSVAEGAFSLVDGKRAKRILAARPAADAAFSDRLLYAVLLENEGLGFDAGSVWLELARERPDDPVLKERTRR
jgi:hypothetical protein